MLTKSFPNFCAVVPQMMPADHCHNPSFLAVISSRLAFSVGGINLCALRVAYFAIKAEERRDGKEVRKNEACCDVCLIGSMSA